MSILHPFDVRRLATSHLAVARNQLSQSYGQLFILGRSVSLSLRVPCAVRAYLMYSQSFRFGPLLTALTVCPADPSPGLADTNLDLSRITSSISTGRSL